MFGRLRAIALVLVVLGLALGAGVASADPERTPPGHTEERGHGNNDPSTAPGQVSKAERGDGQAPPAGEPGGSETQGRSTSEPDNDGPGPERDEGCVDKPASLGGTCTDGDQDGNNGCGNDADRDDDNEGLCGRQNETTVAVAGARRAVRGAAEAEVLGVEFVRPHRSHNSHVRGLAVTGVPTAGFVAGGAALLLIAASLGVGALRARSRA